MHQMPPFKFHHLISILLLYLVILFNLLIRISKIINLYYVVKLSSSMILQFLYDNQYILIVKEKEKVQLTIIWSSFKGY